MAQSSVTIQVSPKSVPSSPSWFAEVAAFAQVLTHEGILKTIQEQVRFARARFGHYDLIDFVAVLIGYMVSGEPTLLAFYERLLPFAEPFMALFGRNQLPHRSSLSRFLAALDQPTVEALRTLFQKDLLARSPFSSPGGLFDRTEKQWIVVDVDGTRQAARQRAVPQTESLPAPHRRLDQVCAPGYQGRKRGEVVRTRTVVLQAHTHQFLGTFGGPGNGDYRSELRRAIQVITTYATQLALPLASVLLRLDGLYGDAAPLLDVLAAGLGVIARSRAYHLLDVEAVKQVLARAPSHVSTHPESGMTRALYDCASVPLTPGFQPDPKCVWSSQRMGLPPLLQQSASSGTAWSTSCLSARFPRPRLPLRMCLTSTCIAARLRQCSLMKTTSKPRIGGIPTPHVARSLARSSRNGCGISDRNWDNSSLQLSCARPSLPQFFRLNQFRKKSLHPLKNPPFRSSMALPDGLALRLREAFPVPLLFRNPMGRCVVLPTIRCIPRNGVPSMMAPCGSCMPHASAIAAPVLCGHSVKRAAPRLNPDE